MPMPSCSCGCECSGTIAPGSSSTRLSIASSPKSARARTPAAIANGATASSRRMRAAGTPGVCRLAGAASSPAFRSTERVWCRGRFAVASAPPMPVALAYRRYFGWGVPSAAVLFGILYIFLWAPRPAHSDPTTFFSTLLDATTQGALYFVVASGFTLIFGLMRVVNMAHGSLYLIAAYVAINVQRRIITGSPDQTISSTQVSIINWFVVLLIAAVIAGVVGLAMQQVLLRWNQGQELRQALITIALSVIVADQIVVRTGGGVAEDMSFPGTINQFVDLHVRHFSYSGARLFILGLALVIGLSLWLWLKRTRTGMVIRAGVD